MKYKCKWCGEEIEILQSEKAKTGLKKLSDHETECFKKCNPNFGKVMDTVIRNPISGSTPDIFDMQGVIAYLHVRLGRIPNENECLRFHMLLEMYPKTFHRKPTNKECEEFVRFLKEIQK